MFSSSFSFYILFFSASAIVHSEYPRDMGGFSYGSEGKKMSLCDFTNLT